MSDAARTEIDLHEDAILPANNPEITPFAELSRLMVIGIDSNQENHLLWTAQTAPNGPWSGTWDTISTTPYIVLGTGCTLDGRVAMAAQTKSSPLAVHYIDEAPDQSDNVERWNAPVDLGMPDGLAGFVQLEMIRDADGRIEIFGIDGATGDIWWIFQNPPKIVDKTEQVTPPGSTTPITVHVQVAEPPDTPWSVWQQLAGAAASRITVTNNADGRILLVAMGQEPQSRSVYVNTQKMPVALAPAGWSGWTRIDDAMSGGAGSLPTAVLDRQGAVNIFMIGNLSQVVQIRQQPPGGDTWSNWVRPGMTGGMLFDVTSAIDGDGHISLMAVGEQAQLFYKQQTASLTQQWSGWEQVGKVEDFGTSMMDYNADGRLTYFQGMSKTNSLKIVSQFVIDSTSWDAGWTMLADNGIFTFGIVRDLTPPVTS
ncbi:hypothetical protein PZ897_01835 [Hoeflea sp. YIM 152468]|uniref:hypothetical protein n=1 Tax=Hoeflea sp. YIM 152468 TaxID=3031759 RepID=UPI0023DBD5E8|nr:hypothetical protein [Hoeflea sp. YIM 152468]MDF1606910.1 hypothetical protein [Hoeflea sp. YIM 152468]